MGDGSSSYETTIDNNKMDSNLTEYFYNQVGEIRFIQTDKQNGGGAGRLHWTVLQNQQQDIGGATDTYNNTDTRIIDTNYEHHSFFVYGCVGY